jgi:peptidyl-prolyl cis-trans isomerase C
MMKKILFAIMILAALAACNKKTTEIKEQKGAVLAKVGTAVITDGDLERELKSLPDYAKQMFADEQGKEKFLDELVKKEMLYQEALKKGLDKSADFVKKVEEFKKLTLVSELLEKEIMAKAKVSDQEAKEYYEKHKEEFATTTQIKASHILVKTEDEANKILARLKRAKNLRRSPEKNLWTKARPRTGGTSVILPAAKWCRNLKRQQQH